MQTLCLSTGEEAAQQMRSNRSQGSSTTSRVTHVLFGDITFLDLPKRSQVSGLRVLLQSLSGQILRRQSVGLRGRYRFNEVPNGDYSLAVEANGRVQVQVPLLINEFKSTDLRHDLELNWIEKRADLSTLEYRSRETYVRTPDNQLLVTSAQLEIDHRELAAARKTLSLLLESDPGDFEAWTQLGILCFLTEDQPAALASFRKALSLNPDYVPMLLNLGNLELLVHTYPEAIEHLGRAVIFEPDLAEAHYLLGEAYLQVKRGSKAVEHFSRALELEPLKLADGHLRMAALYRAAGYVELAVREYRRFLAKRPRSPRRTALEQYIASQQDP